mmetsp:Transcript_32081/g.77565  ORF Transcript_32081/g.77565 Transcript_32081/m.77565 type:complete len:1371 (-) Transcript_32081:1674-5786(-)
MFSLAKYSPKNLLAQYLSQSLAQFFNVDPKLVQTNLIQDAKVVLNNININERCISGGGGAYLKVSGVIEQIEFTWVWGSSELIKDARLTVRGVSVHVTVVEGGGLDHDDASLNADPEEFIGDVKLDTNISDEGEKKDWKGKYMQQIIDHLTVAVTDATVTIHMNDEESLFITTEGVDLKTLQAMEGGETKDASALLQTVSMSSIGAWIEKNGGASTKYPILEPFGYSANVTRISGRRFLDGVLSGLLVEGRTQVDSSNAPSSIRVHAGIHQITGLNRLQQVLLLVGQEGSRGATNSSDNPTDCGSTETAGMKSIFHLPVQSLEVVLENKTNLRLVDCNVKYCTDGSELTVACTGGVWVDDTPLSKDSQMILDLVSLEFLLDSIPSGEQCGGDFFCSTHSSEDVAIKSEDFVDEKALRMDLTLGIFQRIYSGIQSILPHCAEAMETVEQAMAVQPSASTSLWSIRSTRPVTFRFTGTDNTWVEVTANCPKANQGPMGAVSFECSAIDVSSSLGFAAHVPRIVTEENGSVLVEYRVSATLDSFDACMVLHNMYNQVTDVVGSREIASGPSTSLPFDISLGGLDLTVKDPKAGAINLSRIRGSGAEWSVGLIQVKDVKNVSLEASSLAVTLASNEKKEVFLRKIKSFSYNKIEYLVNPIDDTTIILEGDYLSVACKVIHLKNPGQPDAILSEQAVTNAKQLTFPVTLHLTADCIRAEDVTLALKAEVEALNLRISPSGETLMVDIGLKSLKARASYTTLSCGAINSSVEISSKASGDEISLPSGLGQLSSASLTVRDIVNLSTPAGVLAKPLDVIEATYGSRTALVRCDKVLLRPTTSQNPGGLEQSNDSAKIPPINLPVAVYFEVNRLILMQEFGPGKPGFSFDDLRVHLTPNETTVDVNAQCSYFQGRGENHAEIAAKEVKLKLSKYLENDAPPNYLGVKEASLTMKEVSTLNIPGTVKLAEPITNPEFRLTNNSINVACDIVYASYYTEAGGQAVTTEKAQTTAGFPNIPVPVNLTVNIIRLQKGATAEKAEVESLNVRLNPSDDSLAVDVGLKSLKAKASHTTLSCGAINASMKINSASQSLHVNIASSTGELGMSGFNLNGISLTTKWIHEEGQVMTPYLGALNFAQAEVESCDKVYTDTFSLSEPTYRPKLLFREGFLVLEMDKVVLVVAHDLTGSQLDQTSTSMDLGLLNFPIGFNASKLILRAPAADFSLDNVGIDYVPSPLAPKVEMHIQCDKLIECKCASARNINIDLHLKLSGTGTTLTPEMKCIEKASIKIGNLSSLYVEGVGSLSQPLQNINLSYQDGVLATDIEVIQAECVYIRPSVALALKKISLRTQTDPFDSTVRVMVQADTVSRPCMPFQLLRLF